MNKLKEDTVSADRKERIIFDPEAWRKSDKSGKKTSSITSRQNFDNEKFTRKVDKDQVDEGTIQPSGDSKVDSAGPTQSDMISKDTKPKKSNNPQIEFVTGTANPNGSSSTAQGNQPMTGRKLAEQLARKALEQMKEDAGVARPFRPANTKPAGSKSDPNAAEFHAARVAAYNKTTGEKSNTTTSSVEVKKPKMQPRTPQSYLDKIRANSRIRKEETEISEAQYAGLEKEDKPGKKATEFKGSKNAITGKTVEGWKDEKAPVKEDTDTVVKDKQGNVKSWKHEGDWKKSNPNKNPEGKVHNLTGQALKKTKELTKEETESLEESPVFDAIRANTLDMMQQHGKLRHQARQNDHDRHQAHMDSRHSTHIHWDREQEKRTSADTEHHVNMNKERLKQFKDYGKSKLKTGGHDKHLDAMHAAIVDRVKARTEKLKKEEFELEEGRGYNHQDNRTGFGKRHREDDEYHVPDPVDNRETHTIRMKLSKDGGEIQHKQMDVKTLHGAEHAKKFAHDQARKQGWTVHEEVQHVEEGVAGAVAGGLLGAALGPIGVAAGAYLGHKTQQGADASKSVKKKLNKEENDMSLNKEGWDPEQFGSDGSGAGRPGGAGAGDIGKTDKKKKSAKPMKEGKTYSQFMEELDELVEFVPEAIEEGIKIKTATGYIHKGTRGYGNDTTEFDQNDDFDSDDKPKAKPASTEPKRRGNPGTPRGSYKARSAETKAAAAAKSAATKAANKAK